MKDKELERQCEMLLRRTEAVVYGMPNTIELVQKIVESNEPLPTDCPSRAALAVMQFDDITKHVDELMEMCNNIRKHLFDEYSQTK